MARKTASKLASEPAIPESVKLSTRISGELARKLGVLAAMSRTTKAKLITEALETYVDARLARMPSLAIGPDPGRAPDAGRGEDAA